MNHRLLLVALALLAQFGCSKESNTPTAGAPDATPPASSAPAEPSPAEPAPASEPAAAAGPAAAGAASVTGVAECDAFLDAYERCISANVPEASRAAFATGLEQWKSSWKTMAADANTRAAMPQVCEQSKAAAATSLQAYHCSF